MLNKYLLFRKLTKRFSTMIPSGNILTLTAKPTNHDAIVKSPHFKELYTPELKSLEDIFKRYNFEIRIAGGAIRDFLMGVKPKDVDFATTATPSEMKTMFESEGVRLINPNGEKHGTITSRINDKENFEITSLMAVSLKNNQREITFTRDWIVDAGRRDLTINAMFLGLDGALYDFFGGQKDLEDRKIRFVQSAEQRIKEDYLRILRYFRFYGKLAPQPDDHDPEAIKAIQDHASGLTSVSGERKWVELQQILLCNHVQSLIEKMVALGLHHYLGFPSSVNLEEFGKVCQRSLPLNPHPGTLIASLLYKDDEVIKLYKELHFSNFTRDACLFVLLHRDLDHSLDYYKKMVIKMKEKNADISHFVAELYKYQGDVERLESILSWQPPRFPLSGHDIMKMGYNPCNLFNPLINQLKDLWFDSGYTLTREQMLVQVPTILEKIKDSYESKSQKRKTIS